MAAIPGARSGDPQNAGRQTGLDRARAADRRRQAGLFRKLDPRRRAAGTGGRGHGGHAGPSFSVGPPVTTFRDVGANVKEGLPLQPWAAELVKTRRAANSKDNPDAHCLPMGLMQFHNHGMPRKMIQTPGLTVIAYEANYGLRYIFTDGRTLPDADAQPWWYGYSVGKWEGDTLVVESTGFRDDGWLDIIGNPMTEQAKVTERFRRPNYGTLEIDVTIDDPKAYTKPWTVRVNQRILLDSELMEFICLENQQFESVLEGAEVRRSEGRGTSQVAERGQQPIGRHGKSLNPGPTSRALGGFMLDWRLPITWTWLVVPRSRSCSRRKWRASVHDDSYRPPCRLDRWPTRPAPSLPLRQTSASVRSHGVPSDAPARQAPRASSRRSARRGPRGPRDGHVRLTERQQRAFHVLVVLGADLRSDFTADGLRSAYRSLARRYHPDRHPDSSQADKARLARVFADLNEYHSWLLSALIEPADTLAT